MSIRSWFVLGVVAVFCCACTTTGPISAPVAAGAAAMLAVFDQLLAGGVITAEQHATLVQSVTALDTAVEAAKRNALTPEEAGVAAGGLTAAVLAAIRLWRGPATKAENVAKAAEVLFEKTHKPENPAES